ncbi:notchless protein homolog 1 isoform X2 [Nilaparvata lugens]|nr:notchless protein homolog 1 isoform X2 [Nilaparvata lugens]
MEDNIISSQRVLTRFVPDSGEEPVENNMLDLPTNVTVEHLTVICNSLLKQDDSTRYVFYVDEKEITKSLDATLDFENRNTEKIVEIVYQQQAVFRVRPVTRCTSSLPGHSEAVISVAFSPDSKHLASGSGDTTVRFWDILTQTPSHTCRGHKNWVLCIAWSPDSTRVASGCKNGVIRVWDVETGQPIGNQINAHKAWVTAISWEPYHSNPECRYFASSSKDASIKIWDAVLGQIVRQLSSHTSSVTALKWGGTGHLYSASQDRTIKVWKVDDHSVFSSKEVTLRTLQGHAHWVNTLALSTDYVLRTSAVVTPADNIDPNDKVKRRELALSRFNAVHSPRGELLVSGSDDFTLFLWSSNENKPIARMTGHQQLINHVLFSPDARTIASASFDKSIKLWHGTTGKFIATLRGHVQAVYMVAWSADSRLMVSGSADSTLKVWNMKTKKLEQDLPGHADEVFAVDWSPDGQRVGSGGKDKVLRL